MTQNTDNSDKKAAPPFIMYPSFMADKYVEAEIAADHPRDVCLMVSDYRMETRRFLMAVTGDLKFEGELEDMATAGEWAAKSLACSLSGSCAEPLLVFEASPKEGEMTPARINFFSDGRIEGVRPEDEQKAAAFWGSMLNTLLISERRKWDAAEAAFREELSDSYAREAKLLKDRSDEASAKVIDAPEREG